MGGSIEYAKETGVDTSRKAYANNADKASTSAQDPTQKLPEAIQAVGNTGQVLPEMVTKLAKAGDVLKNMNDSNGIPSAGIQGNISSALSGALGTGLGGNLSGIVGSLTKALGGGSPSNVQAALQSASAGNLSTSNSSYSNSNVMALSYISPININIIVAAFAKAIANTYYPNITFFANIPVPLPPSPGILLASASDVPDWYIEQYYPIEADPYPGYVQWVSIEDQTSVFTIRTISDVNYPSCEDKIIYEVQTELILELGPYIIANTLTANVVNSALNTAQQSAQQKADNSSTGKGSSSNLMGMLTQLLGQFGGLVGKANNSLFPQSVLNVGDMSKSLEKYTKQTANVKQMMQITKGAFDKGNS